jgi:flagellar hook protein FlgE
MLKSMYSGVSGVKSFQTKLDVIGNNIANVNTYGFKKGRATFKDTMSQTINAAFAQTATVGGINAKQVGQGTQIATIDTIHDAGSLQTTNRTLDLSIQGDGYFKVQKGATGATGATENFYTRAGNFYFDKQGYLVTGSGEYVLDTASTRIMIPTTATNISIGTDGEVSFTTNPATTQTFKKIAVVRFPNNGGLEKAGGNLFKESNNSGTGVANVPGVGGAGTILSGALEMSNVDLSEEFTEMIIAQRAFQSNTKMITTSDEILQELINLKR